MHLICNKYKTGVKSIGIRECRVSNKHDPCKEVTADKRRSSNNRWFSKQLNSNNLRAESSPGFFATRPFTVPSFALNYRTQLRCVPRCSDKQNERNSVYLCMYDWQDSNSDYVADNISYTKEYQQTFSNRNRTYGLSNACVAT